MDVFICQFRSALHSITTSRWLHVEGMSYRGWFSRTWLSHMKSDFSYVCVWVRAFLFGALFLTPLFRSACWVSVSLTQYGVTKKGAPDGAEKHCRRVTFKQTLHYSWSWIPFNLKEQTRIIPQLVNNNETLFDNYLTLKSFAAKSN